MHSFLVEVIVASLAYVGTMFDNYFAFAAQLVVTSRDRFRKVGWAQGCGVATLVIVASAVSSVLTPLPTRWIGMFCVVPWALASHAWRHRNEPSREQYRRGALTTFLITLALGGDNLAVWIPLFRVNGLRGALVSVVVFFVWEILFVLSAEAIAGHPRVVQWGTKHSPVLIPWVYLALGVLILVEAGTFK